MGACEVSFTLEGKLGTKEVREKFAQVRERAIHEYGHDPYSGTWGTINDLNVRGDLVFETREKAVEALDGSLSWSNPRPNLTVSKREATAVRYLDEDGQTRWLVFGLAAE